MRPASASQVGQKLRLLATQMRVELRNQLVDLGQDLRTRSRGEPLQLLQQYGDLVVLGLQYGDDVGQLGVLLDQRREEAGRLAGVVIVQALASSQAVDPELGAQRAG